MTPLAFFEEVLGLQKSPGIGFSKMGGAKKWRATT
jgi:hypothetical protein